MKHEKIKKIVKDSYAEIARTGCGCCRGDHTSVAQSIGYSKEDLAKVPEANLGLGCGNPTALGEIHAGMTVLDLGSGAGIDCFLAADKVGKSGKVIGVDMTKPMIERARANAKKYGYMNVEFRLGDIEDLPVDDDSVDVIISNCVINLAPDKSKVFQEVFRVLKRGGKILLSDIVLLRALSKKDREDKDLIAGCVGGAVLKDEYVQLIARSGLKIKNFSEDKGISKRQYHGFPLESLKIEAYKE